MKLKLEDLIIRLDEKHQTLLLLVPDRTRGVDDLRVFYEVSEQEIGESGESIEQQLGVIIMSFLSATYSSESFGLGRYENIKKDMETERSQALQSLSEKGDAEAMFELIMQVIAQGLRTKSKAKMGKADRLLKEAAAAGNAEALEYLTDLWPALKKRSDQNFK